MGTTYGKAEAQDRRIRDLVIAHLPLVKGIVNGLVICLNSAVSEEDLISAGTLGLVEAAHRFDESRDVRFGTFAYRRVRGAIMDFLRINDYLGRSARTQLSALRRHVREFRSDNDRKPSIRELAKQAGMSEQNVLKYLAYEKWDHVTSLERTVEGLDGEQDPLIALMPNNEQTPLDKLEWNEKVEKLAKAIENLPEKQKQIIVMYYYEGLYMAETAEILHISESRVSQLHTRALYNLTIELEEE